MVAHRRSIAACVAGFLMLVPDTSASSSPPGGQHDQPTVLVIDAQTGERVWRSGTGYESRAISVEYGLGDLIYGELYPCPVYNRPPVYDGASFLAIDLANGDERWRVDVPGFDGERSRAFGSGYANTFGVGNAAVVIEDLRANLQGLHPRTGKLLWEQPLGSAFPTGGDRHLVVVETPPVDDRPITGGLDPSRPLGGQLDARDRQSGELRWTWQPPSGWRLRQVAVSEKVIVVGTFNPSVGEALRGVDVRTGEQLWEQALPSGTLFTARVNVFGPAVVLEDGTGTVRGYDISTGRHLWDSTGTVMGSARTAARRPLLVRASEHGALMRLDPSDGSQLWRLPRSSKVGPFAFGAGLILLSARQDAGQDAYESSPLKRNDIMAIDVRTGETRWKKTVPTVSAPVYGQSAVIGNGRVVLSGGCDLNR